MDKEEAKTLLTVHLEQYRHRPYEELLSLLGTQDVFEITAPSGKWYQIEIEAVWDNKEKGHLRVWGAIDDGGIRAFFPLSDDFIIASDGTFVGE